MDAKGETGLSAACRGRRTHGSLLPGWAREEEREVSEQTRKKLL
jgi:hypothetical protein